MKHRASQPPEVLENLRKVAARMDACIELKSGHTTIGQLRLQDGRVCYFLPSSLDINPVGAASLARDKDSASYVMSRMGYRVVEGKAFALLNASTRERNRTIDRAYRYATRLGLPVITKPNSSSRGRGVTLAHTKREFHGAIEGIFKYDNVALVQRKAIGRDYRIVVLAGIVITACERRPLSVTGDGRSTIGALLEQKQKAFEEVGRPSRIDSRNPDIRKVLRRKKITLESVLPEGEHVILMDAANLMSGGEAIDVTTSLHPKIAQTAVNLTRDMGLHLSSVDMIVDGDISGENPFVILEINSAPGLDHFLDANNTKAKTTEDLYFDVMTHFFGQ
ncbi:MAG: hypothetical protein Q8R30_01600 [bacterium]|nr:hypothetical protein [bacterium]